MKKYFFILTVAVTFASCNNSKKNDAINEPEMKSTEEAGASESDLLSGKDWKLVMLDGEKVVIDSEMGSPHVKFENTERISGNLGCNNFGGSYKAEGNQISFSKITATQMACPNLNVEQSFLEILNTATSFRISNDTLVLNNETKEAKLVIQ